MCLEIARRGSTGSSRGISTGVAECADILTCIAPTKDFFKPPPEAIFSKRAVDRGGKLLRDFYSRPDQPGEDGEILLGGFDLTELTDALTKVTWWREEHAYPLSKVAVNLRYHVMMAQREKPETIAVTQRLKKRSTMLNKLLREPTMALTQMHDIGGVRARLPNLRAVNAVSRRLKKSWTIVKTRDYVESPKDSGYRAVHHSVKRDGRIVEVQLRTERQDTWANQVEDDGRNLAVGFKFGLGADDIHNYYRVMAEAFAILDRGEPLPEELQRTINERYQAVSAELGRRVT